MNIKDILFSVEHRNSPFSYNKDGVSVDISDKKTKVIALSILYGLIIFAPLAYYSLSAKYKVEAINAAKIEEEKRKTGKGNQTQTFDSLADVATNKICSFLDLSDLQNLAHMNTQTRKETTPHIVKKANEIAGKNRFTTSKEANDYFASLHKVVTKLIARDRLPQSKLVYKGKSLDLEKTLEKLKTLTMKELMTLYENKSYETPYGIENMSLFNKFIAKSTIVPSPHVTANDLDILVTQATTHAIRTGDVSTLTLFIKNGANPNASLQEESLLYRSIRDNNLEVTKKLLEFGANPNFRDIGGMTPLHRAVCSNNVNMIKMLIEWGADLTIQDVDGDTPLDFADIEIREQIEAFQRERELPRA